MSSFKNKKNLLQQRSEYARYFDNLRGVDFSSDHNDVEDSRFAYLVNMYRDYKSGQGGAVETIPGFRAIRGYGRKINGIHVGDNKIFLHIGSWLYYVADITEDGIEFYDDYKGVAGGLSMDKPTTSFFHNGYLYILGGGYFGRIENEKGSPTLKAIHEIAYVPTTYERIAPYALIDSNPDDYGPGDETEQRNLLTPQFKHTFIADGQTAQFDMKEPIDNDWYYSRAGDAVPDVRFPDYLGFSVYQYGVKLPLAVKSAESMAPQIPAGYPNAIYWASPDGSEARTGQFSLVTAPPAPENNNWNPETKEFEDTSKPNYEWPFAYDVAHAGIEITATHTITRFGGMSNPRPDQHTKISECTIAALYDNRVFLSGNPNYPKTVFYSAIPNDGSGVAVAEYFGQLNYNMEGTSRSPVIAMMNVGDSLMVMKRDSDEDDSVILHTAQLNSNNVQPKIYPSQRGHKGIGCLGPCFNFRDDPIFLSRFGVDALGHVSTKYRRAIKHRSSMIDAKLLNCYLPPLTEDGEPRKCDLKDASVTEWNGYLMILVAGRIFMAASRQMYNTPNGNTEYEWYYLEDIGVYNGQFDEYVYGEFPTEMTEEERLIRTGGVELIEARKVYNDNGLAESLIGSLANHSPDDIKSVETEYGIEYYRELPEYDEFTNLTGKTIKYYVVPSGGKTGGKFDPAVMLKTIGDDLFFATEGGVLCKFNFGMRDPETGLIPNQYYDFNGRTIFSGCATKMDNCGIPHLTKTTVKRSTVIKFRTFEASGAKVKVRTNRNVFNQVARIISGTATFNDPDFRSYSFTTDDKSIFSINEREKKWVEKQIFVYSDEFRRPFAIHYLAYRYTIAGRYKE